MCESAGGGHQDQAPWADPMPRVMQRRGRAMATVWRRATPIALTLSVVLAMALVGARDAGRGAARAAPGEPPGEILVRWQGGTAPRDMDLPRGLTPAGDLAAIGVERYQVAPGSETAQVAALRADPRVEFAELNAHYHLTSTPNDPQFPRQWNMRQIHAPEAWDVGTGAADVIVAVLDSGIDGSHVE